MAGTGTALEGLLQLHLLKKCCLIANHKYEQKEQMHFCCNFVMAVGVGYLSQVGVNVSLFEVG